MHIYTCICMCVYIYIYNVCIYIYIERERERARPVGRAQGEQNDAIPCARRPSNTSSGAELYT